MIKGQIVLTIFHAILFISMIGLGIYNIATFGGDSRVVLNFIAAACWLILLVFFDIPEIICYSRKKKFKKNTATRTK